MIKVQNSITNERTLRAVLFSRSFWFKSPLLFNLLSPLRLSVLPTSEKSPFRLCWLRNTVVYRSASKLYRREHKGVKEKRNEGFVKTRNCIFHAGRHRLSFCIPIFPVDRARIAENISDRKKWREQKVQIFRLPVKRSF